MRINSLEFLAARKWSEASSLAIEHFNTTVFEHDKGLVSKIYLLDSIDFMSRLGTHDIAERLTLYLELLNSFTERGKLFDEQIVNQVIVNLGELGDKVAFSDLSYTQMLNYSQKVKDSAEEAIEKLQW